MDRDLKEKLGLDPDKPIPADYNVPYYIHEDDINREEHHTKRWFVVWIITFAALILTNLGWIIYENQYEDVVSTQTITQDSGEGGNNTFTGDFYGGEYNGEADGYKNH